MYNEKFLGNLETISVTTDQKNIMNQFDGLFFDVLLGRMSSIAR